MVIVSFLNSDPCYWNWLSLAQDVRRLVSTVPQRRWPRGLCADESGREIPLRGVGGTSTGLCGIAEISKFCGKIKEKVIGGLLVCFC